MFQPLTRKTLRGVWCALITPWTDKDELDQKRYIKEIRSYRHTGVNGIYTGGITGEWYAQDDATFERIARITCEEGHALRLPVQIGCTALSTRSVRQRIRIARKARTDGIQIALPFWLELKDDEVTRFFREIADEADGTPIILYQTTRSKRRVEAQLLGELAHRLPTFIGTKDTACDVPGLKAMLKEAPGLAIFGGEDFFTKIPAGGKGGYCSVTGFNAKKVVELYQLCANGCLREAKPLADAMHRFVYEALVPLVKSDGLWDSAIDRIQRVAGGGNVGLGCQSPYRSGTMKHVRQVLAWCKKNTPELMPA